MARYLPGLNARRNEAKGAAFTTFWRFAPLARSVRISLWIVVLFAVLADGWFRLSGDLAGGWAEFAFSAATSLCFLAMLWRPPVAATALVLAGFAAVALGQGGGYLTALTASIGLVLYSCATSFAVAYGVAVVVWIVVIAVLPPSLPTGGVVTLCVIALLSAAIGLSIRAMATRNRALSQALDTHDERLENELRAERARIADELHDIIAHDITIVAMHARVLDHTSDPEARAVSQQAIIRGAGQALADTRRVLHLMHGRQEDPSAPVVGAPGIRQVIPQLAEQLRALGNAVEVALNDGPELAKSIDAALVRMAREAVTNIIKHAGERSTVRFTLTFARDVVELRVVNDPYQPRVSVPASPGYGLARLAERADLLGGSFAAGADGNTWTTRMALPQR